MPPESTAGVLQLPLDTIMQMDPVENLNLSE